MKKIVKETVEEVLVNEIQPLALDLGRADLNLIVDKLNEVIKRINS
jgi:hypothetical protein